MDLFERKEYKFYVPSIHLDALRERMLNHIEHDPFCTDMPLNRYSVRSIYLDTARLLFYYEKVDGLKVRKKLRVRVYNHPYENTKAFLEIKRKVEDTIIKERATIFLEEVPLLSNGARIQLVEGESASHRSKLALDRFIYLTKRLNLEPQVLITYEREAFEDIDSGDLRVTFDMNVRSFINPDYSQIYQEEDLRSFTDPFFILEVKFSTMMPLWLKETIREYGLHLQSISKYCLGLDEWSDISRATDPS